MIHIRNTEEYNELRLNILGGKVTSIWKGDTYFKGTRSFPIINFHYFTSEFSDFEKNVFKMKDKMIYHLSGYGMKYNEALASFIGESSERYAFTSFYNIIKNHIVINSYENIIKKVGEGRICDLKYVNSYFSKQDKEYYVNSKDVLQWIKLNSLINIGDYVYVPLQFIVSNNGTIFKDEKEFMTSAVSTGTASQESIIKSLKNAIIEYLQIDSFNLWWYGGIKGKELDIDVKDLLEKVTIFTNKIQYFINNFNIKFTDISYDKDIDIVVCEAFAKNDNLPKYTVGVQGGEGIEKVIYRSFMECIAVLEYNMNLPWMNEEKYISVGKEKKEISNLDDNVILYAKYGKPEIVKHEYDLYKSDKSNKKKYSIIESLKKYSKYAGFINITLPDFSGLNLNVTRVSIPEMLPLSLPSYPPYKHCRYKQIGGIRNNVPHPLA